MKETIALITAVVGLLTALLGLLNRAGTIDVPVINEIPIFQNDDDDGGGGGGGGGVEMAAVPDVRGMTVEDATATLEDAGFHVSRIDSKAIELCDQQGLVESSSPPAGWQWPTSEGVELTRCG